MNAHVHKARPSQENPHWRSQTSAKLKASLAVYFLSTRLNHGLIRCVLRAFSYGAGPNHSRQGRSEPGPTINSDGLAPRNDGKRIGSMHNRRNALCSTFAYISPLVLSFIVRAISIFACPLRSLNVGLSSTAALSCRS